MGDIEAQVSENISEPNTACNIPKSSIDVLKESKPSENIAISEPQDKLHDSSTTDTAVAPSTINETMQTAILKTACESESEKINNNLVDELKNNKTATDDLKSTTDSCKQNEKVSLKNRSDIFSLNENKNLAPTIFSVGGAPSKTIHSSFNSYSNRTSSNDTIGSISKQTQFRNPLTGIGVSSNDEFKNKPTKRRDGNPLLGVGYKDDNEFFGTTTTQRIPPGGYSKGLW
ncbi:hypothetical protein Zmor_001734 [Zophobas morio]|uniref:Microtubule-associated protein Jupiter n=2 Tax=Zophobas morio TaxID=2755281 RepID=A0AA38J5T1_9CUCU|nr:hypothetical protein Zmor_001734 [Zophobas morio]